MSKQEELDKLEKSMKRCKLPLKETANNLVFGKGSCEAKAFFIGEAPGKHEDLQGLPFVGAAGKLLNTLLEHVKLPREEVFITSILKYRPPNNRPPQIEEIKAHTPFLVKQIKIIKPAVILPMGNFAARYILSGCDCNNMSSVEPITQLHGKPRSMKIDGELFTVIPLYHPAAGLYSFKLRKDMLKDFRTVHEVLHGA
jgi:uracil-DNA glycosylase